MSLYKDIPLYERLGLRFQASFYQILNHPVFTHPGIT